MKKTVFLILWFVLSVACSRFDRTQYDRLAINPDYEKPFDQIYTIVPSETLDIKITNRPIEHLYKAIYNDTLYFGTDGFEQDRNVIDVIDIKNKTYLKKITLPEYQVVQNIKGISVHNFDTIFLWHYYPPVILLTNFNGTVQKKIKPGNIPLNIGNIWVKTKLKDNDYGITMFNNSAYIIKNRLYIGIEPLGFTEAKGYRKAERILIYNLETNSVEKAICQPQGPLSIENVYYLNQLMHPYFIIVNDTLYVNYPLDHYVYLYDLEGNFLKKKLASASKFERLPDPVPPSKKDDNEFVRRWWITIPRYGPIYYHPKVKLFTRIFCAEQPLRMPNGQLNDGSKRTAYVLIFDENFNKVGETKFLNGKLNAFKTLPLSNGFLSAPNPEYWTNENEFVYKYIYKFKKLR